MDWIGKDNNMVYETFVEIQVSDKIM